VSIPHRPTTADRDKALAVYLAMQGVKRPASSPAFIAKAANFAKAAVKHVAAGAPMASEDEIARRHAICASCEFFTGTACAKCGCAVIREKQYLSKLSWADQSCPVGKWGPQTNLDS
jgi:hypothetical protein